MFVGRQNVRVKFAQSVEMTRAVAICFRTFHGPLANDDRRTERHYGSELMTDFNLCQTVACRGHRCARSGQVAGRAAGQENVRDT